MDPTAGARARSHWLFTTLLMQTVWFAGGAANAATFVVVATDDAPDRRPGDGVCAASGGRCTLRAAIEEANARPGFDSIYLSTDTYVLSRGPLVIRRDVEVIGHEPRFAIIDANRASRVLEIAPRAGESIYVRLSALWLENGVAGPADPRGGAVLNASPTATLVLQRCVVRDNSAAKSGGGIYNAGTLELWRSGISSNTASGDPAAAGGGIYNTGSVSLIRSALDHNVAVRGGGLANDSGSVSSSNSTFSVNVATTRGGGLANEGTGSASLEFTTIADNQAGDDSGPTLVPGQAGGIYSAGALQLVNTIVARNRDLYSPDSPSFGPDCVLSRSGSLTSLGGLVLGVITGLCPHALGSGDQRGSAAAPLDPGLGDFTSLRPNEVAEGFDLRSDSVAIDAAVGGTCSGLDQWGQRRPGEFGATPRCDSGATEQNSERVARTVMMIVGDRDFLPTDLVLAAKLADHGFDIVDESPSDLTTEVLDTSLAVISETVNSSELPDWLMTIPKPILTLEPGALDELWMTAEGWDRTQGVLLGATRLRVVAGPIDAGLRGRVIVTDGGAKFGWGVPATSAAFRIAELTSAPGRWAIFGYPAGARLAGGRRAAAARVAFFAADGTPQQMNEDGWSLFTATLNYLVP